MENPTNTPPPVDHSPLSLGKPVFQDAYIWLVLVASLDIMCTWIVLWHHGVELNPVAAKVISYGPKGLVTYKFLLIVFVIALCEIVGRRSRSRARILIGAAIGLTSIPVILAVVQLFAQKHGLLPP